MNDPVKGEKLRKFKSEGATLIEGDISNPISFQDKLKGIDVVISAISEGAFQYQIGLIKAAKAAGIKRFVPSEFGGNHHHFQ